MSAARLVRKPLSVGRSRRRGAIRRDLLMAAAALLILLGLTAGGLWLLEPDTDPNDVIPTAGEMEGP